MSKDKVFESPLRFELKLAGQPTKTFNSGWEVYNYAVQNSPKMAFEEKQHADKPRTKRAEGKANS